MTIATSPLAPRSRRNRIAAGLAGAAAIAGALGACALSPTARIESQLAALGLSPQRAACMAGELTERLDRRDLGDLARFLGGLNRAESAGAVIDMMLRIDNPRAVSATAASAFRCAIRA